MPFPINDTGTEPIFLPRAYGMLIHCFVITIPEPCNLTRSVR